MNQLVAEHIGRGWRGGRAPWADAFWAAWLAVADAWRLDGRSRHSGRSLALVVLGAFTRCEALRGWSALGGHGWQANLWQPA